MELGKENAEVTGSFDNLLDEWALFLEIWLDFKKPFGATVDQAHRTFILALH